MLQGWLVILVALAYIGLLFIIASYGDQPRFARRVRSSRLIYPLSLAIYCTSWTFFGSVGLASRNGFDFLTIYVGPIIMIGLCYPLLVRVVRLAKTQNITSIADFIAARYGKSQAVAATVALIAILGSIPYIALQLKAVSSSLSTILTQASHGERAVTAPVLGDLSAFVAMAMAAFAVLFGTRHADATEHQEGLMLAIATESIVKLVAFLIVGIFVTYFVFGGAIDLFAQATHQTNTAAVLSQPPQFSNLLTMTALSFFAILLLPRQFHVAVVENKNEAEIRRAGWLFPLYLVLINLFVVPIALAGMMKFPAGSVDSDMFVLALPLHVDAEWLTLIAFVGGLSAATAMVIVESVALAIMVSNDLVMPWVLKRRQTLVDAGDVGAFLLRVRRLAIFVLLFLAYAYYRFSGDAQLASIGLLSFAAIAQFAPAFFGGLIWRDGTARGAIAGMTVGIAVWTYMLLLPSLAAAGVLDQSFVVEGPLGLAALRPQAFLGLDLPPLVHGVVWSLSLNALFYVAGSLTREPSSIERVQASVFVPSQLTPAAPSFRLWRSAVSIEELTATVARYLGEERTRESFASFAAMRRISLEPKHEADIQLLQHAEHLLASTIGAASSRLVLSLLLRKRTVSRRAALKLLDEANSAIHYNRELLQTSLDHVRQGIAVFDKDLQLACWNRQFGELLDIPPERVRAGARLQEIVQATVQRGEHFSQNVEAAVRTRASRYLAPEPFLERFPDRGLVIEVRPNRMPDGGIVVTFTDITPTVEAAEALERRVRERTEQLTGLNAELERAKAQAEEANLSKTRFLAAASHDLVQPLNAARLYVSSLVERQGAGQHTASDLVGNIDASLEAVEEIISALLEISRLDAGAMTPELGVIPLADVFRQLEVEFAPLARAKGIHLRFSGCSLSVRSDRRLLRRVLQNLISNAVKYTPHGGVLVGCRRRGKHVRIDIYDQGLGIAEHRRADIFKEFHRLDEGARVARGLGLGLSIVERISKVLGHRIGVASEPGRGSHFWLELPAASAAEGGSPMPARASVPMPLVGMTVFCIDNEAAILEGMQALLGGWGCVVLTATGLADAQDVLTPARAIDALLVDFHLNDSDGLKTIDALRAAGCDCPAILITADRSAHVRAASRAAAVHLLQKPLKPAALRALLARWRARHVVAAE